MKSQFNVFFKLIRYRIKILGKNIIIKNRVIGRNVFHVRFISLSYRIRGSVARAQIKRKEKNVVFVTNHSKFIGWFIKILKKKIAVSNLIIRMFVYSAMKISAKVPLLNSVLNPETNSDSPSAWSNGVRLVSANVVITHIMNIVKIINKGGVIWFKEIKFMLNDFRRIREESKISVIDTSYEMVWATLRSAPNNEYLEFEDHPAPNRV